MNLCQLIIYSRTSTLENNLYSFKQYQTIIISAFKLDIAVAWHIYSHLKSHSIPVYYTAKVSKLQRLMIGLLFMAFISIFLSQYWIPNKICIQRLAHFMLDISRFCWSKDPGVPGEGPGRWWLVSGDRSQITPAGPGQWAPGWGLCRARPQYCLGK